MEKISQRRSLKLSATQRKELVEHRDHDRRPDIRERCAALLKIAEGEAPYAVARRGLLKRRLPDTVYGWLNLYEQEGLEGLLTRRHGGNHRSPFCRSGEGLGAIAGGTGGGSSPRGGSYARRPSA